MPASKPLSDEDVIANQAALKHADSYATARSLLLSMIGDDYSDDEAAPKETAEEEEVFNGFGEDTGGIGYVRPTEQEGLLGQTRDANAATEKLRKQMLGKRANIKQINYQRSQEQSATKPRPRPAKRKDESDDEEHGRSGPGKRRREVPGRKQDDDLENTADKPDDGEGKIAPASIPEAAPSKRKRGGGSYLDQVLAERAAKKKRKRKVAD